MSRLPKRPREHELETESQRYIEQILPPAWLVQVSNQDYGIDLSIEIVSNSEVTGARFLLQLRATDKLKTNKRRGLVIHRCKTSTLKYFLQRTEPIIYLVYEAQGKRAYWIWIQDYLRNELYKDWQDKEKITIKIPITNEFNHNTLSVITKRVMSIHEQNKWLAAIQTVDNPYYKYNLKIEDGLIGITVGEKYFGSSKDKPLVFKSSLKFDDSPEATATISNLNKAFRTGDTIEIDSRFIDEFQLPDIFDGLFAHTQKFQTDKLILSSVPSPTLLVVKLRLVDESEAVLAEIPYVVLRQIKAGTEEVTLSNQEQDTPFEVVLKPNQKTMSCFVSFGITFSGVNVQQIKRYLDFQTNLKKAYKLELVMLENDLTVAIGRFLDNVVIENDEGFAEIIEDLCFIQENTKTSLNWPAQLEESDVNNIKKIVQIIRTGRTVERWSQARFEFEAPVVNQLVERMKVDKKMRLRGLVENIDISIFDKSLSLGPIVLIIPHAELSTKTLNEPSGPMDALVPVDVDVKDSRVICLYPNWLKESTVTDEERYYLQGLEEYVSI